MRLISNSCLPLLPAKLPSSGPVPFPHLDPEAEGG